MPLPVHAVFLRIGRRRLVVARIPALSQAYGHLALELVYGVGVARRNRASLLVVRPRRVVNEGLYRLVADDVHIRAVSPRLGDLSVSAWNCLRWLAPTAPGATDPTLDTRGGWAKELNRRLDAWGRERGWTKKRRVEVATRVRRLLRVETPRKDVLRDTAPPYFRRRALRDSQPLRLAGDREAAARAALVQLGVPEDGRVVTLHVRGPGFKRGREAQDKSAPEESESARDDSTRNADVRTYYEAIDRLVGLGYTVVRIGDSSMERVERPGVVDLATAPGAGPDLELHALARSDFLISSESGPQVVAFVTGTPSLVLNATDPVSSFPVRPADLFLLKGVVELESGRLLALPELLEADYLSRLRHTTTYRYVDNTTEEILASVQEMLVSIAGGTTESGFQRAFREALHESARELRSSNGYLRKWGLDGDYLGAGRIAQVAEARWTVASRTAAAG